MRKSVMVGLVAGLMAPMALIATPTSAEKIGNEGCTPGYWKNHTDNWEEANPGKTTLDMAGFDTSRVSGDHLLRKALRYRGGRGLAGAERILMRAASAAWLNAAHEGLGYPYRRFNPDYLGIVESVNDAIDSDDRGTMLRLARKLDRANNLGCPLN